MKAETITAAKRTLSDITSVSAPTDQETRGERMKQRVSCTLLALIFFMAAGCSAAELPPGAASVTFVVHCYDVGATALEGRPGVLKVERGWKGWHEVDRVIYDPRRIDEPQMRRWLEEADTYVRTLDGEK